MTVTSSLADENMLYLTLIFEPKSDEARKRLRETETSRLLSYRIPSDGSSSGVYMYNGEADAFPIDISTTWWTARNASVRFDLMDQDIWLKFPIKNVRSLTLKVNAEAQGICWMKTTAGPVTVDRMEISPVLHAALYRLRP